MALVEPAFTTGPTITSTAMRLALKLQRLFRRTTLPESFYIALSEHLAAVIAREQMDDLLLRLRNLEAEFNAEVLRKTCRDTSKAKKPGKQPRLRLPAKFSGKS